MPTSSQGELELVKENTDSPFLDTLDEYFFDLMLRSYEVLIEDNKYSLPKLRALFNSFPSTCRHEHKGFLDKYILKIEQNITVDDLWAQFCSYMHFINYKLLKFLIDKSKCESLISDMNTYERDIMLFVKKQVYTILSNVFLNITMKS